MKKELVNFNALKDEFTEKCKAANACSGEFRRVLASETEEELLKVISDNLPWCSENKVISKEFFDRFTPEVFALSRLANTGEENIGWANTGDSNTGSWNTGYSNTGDSNTGYSNTGDSNTGSWNTGSWNTGSWNTGSWNTGDRNTGDRNTGSWNTGDRNTGSWNTGDRNTGYSNTGDRNTGAFCTGPAPFPLFNKPSEWTEKDFLNSKACQLLQQVDTKLWIPAAAMTAEEKLEHKGWEPAEGFFQDIPFKQSFTDKWNNWSDENKKAFLTLPNFDPEIFHEITGVKI